MVADQGLYDSGDGRMTECEADLLRKEIERQKHTIAALAQNNVSLVALIHDLEKQLREAKRKPI